MFQVHLWHSRESHRRLPLPRCRVVKIRVECESGHTPVHLICRRNPDFHHTSTSTGCTARCCNGTSTHYTRSLKKGKLMFIHNSKNFSMHSFLLYTPLSLTGLPLTGLLVNRTDGVPVIRTVLLTGFRLTGIRLAGTEYTQFDIRTVRLMVVQLTGIDSMEYTKFDIRTLGSPVNKSG